MSGFKINFVLRDIGRIVPWGEKKDYLSWFGLTDSDLWITAGDKTIYEYSDAARIFWDCDIRYNDYQLSRFLEDLTWTFEFVRGSVPSKYYNITEELPVLFDRWHTLHLDDDDEVFDKFYDEEYYPLIEWFYDRTFDSGHLVGGPQIGCFRCEDMLKIWWFSDYRLESGKSIWTAPSGVFELPYSAFVSEIRRFFGEFFDRMDEQVQKALEKDWGTVRLDKTRLAEEHKERREGFFQKIALLDDDIQKTSWDKIDFLYDKMCGELGS